MKVEELIEMLNRCDGASEVYVNYNNDNPELLETPTYTEVSE